jgi:DNA modification methylase
MINQLILGDNLEVLKKMDSESVDLIYLDPPFFSNRNYEVIWGDEGEVRSFQDRWAGGVSHYIDWLKERVIEMHRILRPSGSIFLHCDWHANAYIRVEILDKVFGYQNFRNEVIWKRADTVKGNVGQGKKSFDYNTDTIFFYTKSDNYFFEQPFKDYTEEYINDFYHHIEPETGRRYQLISMTGPGGASKGNPEYEVMGVKRFWRYSKEKMQELIEKGLVVQTSPGAVPRKKLYLDDGKGVSVQSLWDDISALPAVSKERIGYPTQKPEALLKRIIECASNEGDLVLDPFVGGGTTVAVADKLGRRWVGIDQSVQAIKLTELRLYNQADLFSKPFFTQLHKYDYDTLRYKEAFEFEQFIIHQFGGVPNVKQRGDLGLDGRTLENIPIQVKRSDNIGRNVVDNFHSAIQRHDKRLYEKCKAEGKPAGHIIAFSFGKGAVEEVARLKNSDGIIIKLVEVEDIVPISKKPALKVAVEDLGKDKKGLHEIQFRAEGQSASGIEFYSWDFDYKEETGLFKAEVLLDKQGEQVWRFKPGLHKVAVKVVDNEGLENVEVLKLKVNGAVEMGG